MNGTDAGYGPQPQIPPGNVDDALQFTPLSSVVPFSPDTICLPTLSSLPTSIYQTENDRATSKGHLNLLNQRAESNKNSGTVRQYYDNLTTQLGSAEATQFRFKALSDAQSPVDVVDQRAIELLRNSGGGRFAEMILARNSVAYTNTRQHSVPQVVIPQIRHATTTPARNNTVPASPSISTTPITSFTPYISNYGQVPQTPRTPIAPPPATPSNGAVRPQSFQIQIPVPSPAQSGHTRSNGLQASMSPTPPMGSQVAEAVVIKPATQIDRSEYVRIDTTMKASKAFSSSNNRKRKRAHFDVDDDEPMAAGVDERARADNDLANLQVLLESIYLAEDNVQDGVPTAPEYSKFWLRTNNVEDGPILSNTIHHKLSSAIKRTIIGKRFYKVPLEDILRLERLCENALRREELPKIMPPTNPAETDMDDWLGRIGIVDNGLRTSKTVLRIMLGGRDEKQIYSEDLLNVVLRFTKSLIEESLNPMIELRSSSEQQDLYRAAFSQKKILGGLLSDVTAVLTLFAQMVAGEEAAESAITSALYMAASIVFIENATNEKDSIFGLPKVEMFRLAAMDVLTKIFARYPDQRSTIFEQILQNLEKLPVNRASARQFKLLEGGKNIQLVSALIMRLIQTSGTYRPKKGKRVLDSNGEGLAEDDEGDGLEKSPSEAVSRLKGVTYPLYENAFKNAGSVVGYLVSKAMTSTKSGDQPYRHLLDMFTEDFLAVLGSPEWPGAEILLRSLMINMCAIIDQDKPAAVAKTMALDMLGLMGSGICDLIVHLRESHRSRDTGNDSLETISRLTDIYLDINSNNGTANDKKVLEEGLYSWDGPFRVALEYLFDARMKDNTLQTACGYFLTSWGMKIFTVYEKIANEGEYRPPDEIARCASTLRKVIVGKDWDDDFDLDSITEFQVRQAYALAVLNMPFCSSFEYLFNRLLRSVDDNQAQSRSKSLKSIMQLLAKDPTILKRTKVIPYIQKKSEDASPLVRDSAVDLLGKCIAIKPDIEPGVYTTIIRRANDTGVAVRKRAMRILKDVYLTTNKTQLKVAIAEALIQRIKDGDAGVAEQAKKTFEEIWIQPFYIHISENDAEDKDISPQLKLVANERVNIIVKVVQKDVTSAALLEVIKSLLHSDNKNMARNFQVCRTMVGSMFDDLLDKIGDDNRNIRQDIMHTLTVFAKASPTLFNPSQLELLQPYIANLTSDDLKLFRSVVVIYRFALSILTSRQLTFLLEVQGSLLQTLPRLPQQELNEVISCLRNISLVTNDPERLIRVTMSCINNVSKYKGKVFTDAQEIKKAVRTLQILGYFGHYCDFEPHLARFKALGPQYTTVSGLIAGTLVPCCLKEMHTEIRKAAIENLGRVCQTNAVHFLKPEILNIINTVFSEGDIELKASILEGLKGFFILEESRSTEAASEEISAKVKKQAQAASNTKQLAQSAFATQNDGVSTSLAQTYLKEITSVAMASQDGYALIAVEVIASILRQGLVHPKEVVPCLLALETSTNPLINQIAYREHKALHSKHETIVERGYMEGVRACFRYQLDVAKSPQGATIDPYTAKLRYLYDVVKDGTRRIKKNFLTSLANSTDFELAKLNVTAQPTHLCYARFVIENLIFLDYATTEDVYQVVTTIEKLVSTTGIIIAHAIETDIFFLKIESEEQKAAQRIDLDRLNVLSTAAAILTMLWAGRTYLRKSHGVNENKLREYRLGKVKAADPLMNKTPGRNPQVNANTVWEQIEGTAVQHSEAEQVEQCRQFIEMLSTDHEFKQVADEDDDSLSVGFSGGEASEPEEEAVPATPKGRKRKGSEEVGGRKRKKPAVKRKK